MKNQPGTIKTNLELDRGGLGRNKQKRYRQTLNHNIFIDVVVIIIIIINSFETFHCAGSSRRVSLQIITIIIV